MIWVSSCRDYITGNRLDSEMKISIDANNILVDGALNSHIVEESD